MKQRIVKQKCGVCYALAASATGAKVQKRTMYNEHVAPRMTEKQIIRELCKGWLWG